MLLTINCSNFPLQVALDSTPPDAEDTGHEPARRLADHTALRVCFSDAASLYSVILFRHPGVAEFMRPFFERSKSK
jgi:hypothetical protein